MQSINRLQAISAHLSEATGKQGSRRFVSKIMTASSHAASSDWVKMRTDLATIPAIVLNRPEALNALNLPMIHSLMSAVTRLEASTHTNAILLQAVPGSRAFCAGGDVKGLVQASASGDPKELAKGASFFTHEYRLNHKIGTLSKPIISVLDGITMGGGVGISVHGAFRIVTERTLFAMPETAIGLVPDVGGSFFLPRLDGELGTYLGLTGTRLKGMEVFLAGIGTHYIPSHRLPALYQQLGALESPSFEVLNRILDDFVAEIPEDVFDTWSLGGAVAKSINQCFSHNSIPAILKALESDGSEWALKTLDTLKQMSPTSLAVTLQMIRYGAQMDFASCFRMEHTLATNFMSLPDFREGVTAKLIDKPARTPVWNPSFDTATQKLPPNVVKAFFDSKLKDLDQLGLAKPTLTFYDYPHRTLSGLPTTRDVLRVIQGKGARGHTFSPLQTKDQVLNYFQLHWGRMDTRATAEQGSAPKMLDIYGGQGVGKIGLKQKVESILNRLM